MHIREFATTVATGVPAAEYIEDIVSSARSDFSSFAHRPILDALKLTPDGVSKDVFEGIENEGVNLALPKQLALAMKERNAIIYHHPSREYRLASTAHRTALMERWNATLTKS